MRLSRHPANPVLAPDPASSWEARNVFNPAVIHHDGSFHMHYRAQGFDGVSRIGYAVSQDGVSWDRHLRPVLEPKDQTDAYGVEDPRVTPLDGRFYMAYTAYSGCERLEQAITPMLAVSDDLIHWERLGPLVRGEHNKDHFLLPRRIGDRYVAFHRRPPSIWLAESDDLIGWPEEHMRVVLSPRPANWDSRRIGGGGPPIGTEHGWLLLYHGYDGEHVYRLGVCLLDYDDPGAVVSRPSEPILEPEEPWELEGQVPNVVFSAANPVVDGVVYVYYGAADHVIGLATCPLDELVAFARMS